MFWEKKNVLSSEEIILFFSKTDLATEIIIFCHSVWLKDINCKFALKLDIVHYILLYKFYITK